MNRFLKTAILSAAVAATVFAPAAQAGDFNRRHPQRHHELRHQDMRRHNNDADLLAAGILGIAIGAIIIGGMNDREPAVVQPRPRPHWDQFPRAPQDPEVINFVDDYETAEPWSDEWFQYCENRYRSFDPRTGTYLSKSGARRFCTMG